MLAMESEILKIEKIGHVTKITNNSPFDLIVSETPIPPKRKYVDRILIKKGYSLTFEIDLTLLSFKFDKDASDGK
jgi:hypothetical protein